MRYGLLRAAGWALASVATLWASASMLLTSSGAGGLSPWRMLGAVLFLIVMVLAAVRLPYPARLLVPLAGSAFVVLAWRQAPARADRHWASDHARSPVIEIDGDHLLVRNFRSFRYAGDRTEERWVDQEFDLSQLAGCDYIVVPFKQDPRLAHTMVSFRFSNGPHLAISVEARREHGEPYSVWRALFRQFELIYVMGDEDDLLGVRATVKNDNVFVFGVGADMEGVKRFLLGLLQEAQRLNEEPAWYDTLRSNCTTNLVKSFEATTGKTVGWDMRLLFPGGSAELVYDMGLLDSSRSFEDLRQEAKIDERARTCPADASFSDWIRQR